MVQNHEQLMKAFKSANASTALYNFLVSNKFERQGNYMMIGLDAEVRVPDAFPHLHNLPQMRAENQRGSYDWHGDGFAFELCVQPTDCIEIMLGYVGSGLNALSNILTTATAKPVKEIHYPSLYTVPQAIFDAAPADVRRLGCAQSFTVYPGDGGNPRSLGKYIRTTGCHLHISAYGWPSPPTTENMSTNIKWADILCGATWVYISHMDPADETARRQAYGRAGEHRCNTYRDEYAPHQPTGFEYRVLPGAVLANPSYLSLMFSQLRSAVRLAQFIGDPPLELTEMAREAINTHNQKLAEAVVTYMDYHTLCRTFLDYLHEHKLPSLSVREWVNAGNNGRGHITLSNKVLG